MGVVSIFLASQLKAIVQGEALVNELSAPGYAAITALIAANSRFIPEVWLANMTSACEQAREAWTDREMADRDWVGNNADVRVLVEEGNAWRAEAGDALAYAVAAEVPGAAEAMAQLEGIGTAVDSYEQQRAELPLYVLRMERVDGAALDLSPEFIQRGRVLAARMSAERRDADAAKGARSAETTELGKAMLRIARLAEQLYAARTLAAKRSKEELPGFDLTYIRAAAAAHSAPKDEPAQTTASNDSAGSAEARGL